MVDHGWRFNEEDEWDYAEEHEERRTAPAATPADDTVTGQDADRVVTVTVTPSAEVVSVALAADWKKSVHPHDLHARVLDAANAATMQALAKQVETAGQEPPAQPDAQVPGTAQSAAASDETPITKEDAMRLLDAVSADLEQFTRQMSSIVDQTVSAESSGRHVSGSGRRGQVLDISLDASWAGRVRSSEIEGEIAEVLRLLHEKTSPGALANGPQSPAIAELTALLSDPHKLLRRVGLEPRTSVDESRGMGQSS